MKRFREAFGRLMCWMYLHDYHAMRYINGGTEFICSRCGTAMFRRGPGYDHRAA